MTQTIPATAILSPRRAGQKVGYAILNLDRSEATSFTRRGVVETAPGRFAVRGGIQAPDAGGYIQWQFNGELIAESDIAPAPLSPLVLGTLRSLLVNLPQQFAALVPAPVVDMTPFMASVAEMRSDNANAVTEYHGALDAVRELLATIAETTDGLTVLNERAEHVRTLAQVREQIGFLIGDVPQAAPTRTEPTPLVRELAGDRGSPLGGQGAGAVMAALDALRGEVGQLAERVGQSGEADTRRSAILSALNQFEERISAQ